MQNLRQNWPVFLLRLHAPDLWWVEYNGVGSCVMDNAVSYFEKAVRMRDMYDIGAILRNIKMSPGNEGDLDYIINSISESVGGNVIVRCVQSRITEEQYISEVQICFNQNHRVQDCQHRIPADTDMYPCKSNVLVKIPLVPKRYL